MVGALIMRAEASTFGVVPMKIKTNPISTPAIFITSLFEPIVISYLTVLARRKQST